VSAATEQWTGAPTGVARLNRARAAGRSVHPRSGGPPSLGTLLGTVVADLLKSKYLAIFFVIFVYCAAAQMFANVKPKPTWQLPGKAGMTAVAVIVGIVSSLVGVGGGVMTIPLMSLCNVPMRQTIGTSAALGLPIALAMAWASPGVIRPSASAAVTAPIARATSWAFFPAGLSCGHRNIAILA